MPFVGPYQLGCFLTTGDRLRGDDRLLMRPPSNSSAGTAKSMPLLRLLMQHERLGLISICVPILWSNSSIWHVNQKDVKTTSEEHITPGPEHTSECACSSWIMYAWPFWSLDGSGCLAWAACPSRSAGLPCQIPARVNCASMCSGNRLGSAAWAGE